MKTVFLCGGKGTRLGEETSIIPKPMVKIGEWPIIVHLIKYYYHFGHNNFILSLGYKQEIIKDYFYNYHRYNSNFRIFANSDRLISFNENLENWNVLLYNTGVDTLTGGRLLRVKDYISENTFLVNYADGLSDIDLNELIAFHKSHGKIATLTAIQKQGKFGTIHLEGNQVTKFIEKPLDEDYINGGFFVFNKKIFDYLLDDDLPLTLDLLAKEGKLMAYKYKGNWACMDSLNDKRYLEDLWRSNKAFWKV